MKESHNNADTCAWVVHELEEDPAIEDVHENVQGRYYSEDAVPRWKLISKRSGLCKDIENGWGIHDFGPRD